MKKILLLALGLNFAFFTFGQLINIECEVFHVHDDTEYDEQGTIINLDGYTTYRVYANLTNENDFVISMSGEGTDTPLFVKALDEECNEDPLFWHHPNEAESAVGPVPDGFFIFQPTLAFDSFFTLGWHYETEFPGAAEMSVIVAEGETWESDFNSGGEANVSSDIGGVIFTLPPNGTNDYGFAGDDLRVCLGQFTSKCAIQFAALVQVRVEAEIGQTDPVDIIEYAFCSSEGVPGCTDPIATNFNPLATVDDGSCVYECELVIDSVQVTDVACLGFATGEIEVSILGEQGTALYSIECGETGTPNSSITGLVGGDYNICVTDSEGCMDSLIVTVNEPTPIDINLSSISFPSCAGESDGGICVDITGGDGGPFFISSVNDPLTAVEGNCVGGIEAGTSVVYVWEDLECQSFISQGFFVAEPSGPIINANDFSPASCANLADGEIIVLGQGGTAPYTFFLELDETVVSTVTVESDTIVGDLPCGIYTINMVDANGCEAELPVTNIVIDCPDELELNLIEIVDISCPGEIDGEIEVTCAGGNGTCLYNIGETQEAAEAGPFNNSTGSFEDLSASPSWWIAAQSGNCTTSEQYEVNAPDPIDFNLLDPEFAVDEAGECALCLDVNSVTGGTGGVDWFWEPGFSQDACITGLDVGETVTLTLSDENGCDTIAEEIFTCTVSVFDLENNISISMFPNPTSGIININAEGLNGQNVSAVITNSLGASVQSQDFGNVSGIWTNELNISNESDGIYFLTLTVGVEEVTYRIVKN